jgi:heme A synthase
MTSRLSKYSWAVLAYTIFVLISGAYVRATGSGAGCGSHWPLCNGEVFPRLPRIETAIEFSHRVASGLSLVFILILAVWAWRSSAPGHPVRRSSAFALLFILLEALIGAWLVRGYLVTTNESVTRAVAISLHMINTFLLLASLTLTARWATTGNTTASPKYRLEFWLISIGCLAMLVLSASGAIAALGDTLFPPATLLESFRQDFSTPAHFLTKLRVYHPFIAVGLGIYLLSVLLSAKQRDYPMSVRILANGLIALFVWQAFLGIANVALLAPIWIQLLHLLTAAMIWVSLILLVSMIWESPAGELAPSRQ